MIWGFLLGVFVGIILTLVFLYLAERHMRKQLSTTSGFSGTIDQSAGFRGDLTAHVMKKAI